MMLKVFRGISFVVIHINGTKHFEVTPLTAVQEKILMLLGYSTRCYYGLSDASHNSLEALSEP